MMDDYGASPGILSRPVKGLPVLMILSTLKKGPLVWKKIVLSTNAQTSSSIWFGAMDEDGVLVCMNNYK
jgi:hypothetical protein